MTRLRAGFTSRCIISGWGMRIGGEFGCITLRGWVCLLFLYPFSLFPLPPSPPFPTANIQTDTLHTERDSASKVFIPPSTRAYAFDSPDLSALEWNGREIRNALQTAVALAETEALENGLETVAVEERHLRAVARMSGGFKDFLRGVRGEGEDGESDGEY